MGSMGEYLWVKIMLFFRSTFYYYFKCIGTCMLCVAYYITLWTWIGFRWPFIRFYSNNHILSKYVSIASSKNEPTHTCSRWVPEHWHTHTVQYEAWSGRRPSIMHQAPLNTLCVYVMLYADLQEQSLRQLLCKNEHLLMCMYNVHARDTLYPSLFSTVVPKYYMGQQAMRRTEDLREPDFECRVGTVFLLFVFCFRF